VALAVGGLGGGGAAVAGPAPGLTIDPTWAQSRHTLALSGGFFARWEAAQSRTVLCQVLRYESRASEGARFVASVGWVSLLENSGGGGGLATDGVSNLAFGGRYLHSPAAAPGVFLEVGIDVVAGFTMTSPSAYRRAVREAYGHSIAMEGVWDAWRWAPERGGIVLPLQVVARHGLGGWRAEAALEAAFVQTLPDSEAGESDLGRLVQVAPGYFVRPRPWLSVGTRLQLVWMPTAELFRAQTAVRPAVAVLFGRWQVGGDVVINIDEPYGLAGSGQRIWAADVSVGVRL
jgi:hypothetical protein